MLEFFQHIPETLLFDSAPEDFNRSATHLLRSNQSIISTTPASSTTSSAAASPSQSSARTVASSKAYSTSRQARLPRPSPDRRHGVLLSPPCSEHPWRLARASPPWRRGSGAPPPPSAPPLTWTETTARPSLPVDTSRARSSTALQRPRRTNRSC
ncbi:unnamed protein product [Camellia sinensis]